jgi:DNA-binding NarL/FixJ family response regulator
MMVLSEPTIRVLLSDDHPIFLKGVQTLLDGVSDINIVATADTGGRALRLIAETQPDVLVMDIAMPDMNGVAVLKQIVGEGSAVQVVILSGHEDRTFVREALSAGARGYVLKRSAGENLIQAIRAVHGGGLYLDSAIASRFMLSGDLLGARTAKSADRSKPDLTEREREVFRLVALGFTNKEVAGKLGITSKSVETYRTRASEKLQIRTRAKIVQYAMFQGWFENITP